MQAAIEEVEWGKCMVTAESLRISVVIPTLNEESNLPHVLPVVAQITDEIILVDGFSTDHTMDVAQSLVPGIRLVKQERRGKGNALQVGFAACTGDIIVMMDADGSTDPREIPRFIEPLLRGVDFVKGSRFVPQGGSEDITPLRTFGNTLLTGLVNLLFGVRYTDLCYGYNAFWRDCLASVYIDSDGFEVETLMTLHAVKAKLTIVEAPSVEYRRIHGFSNLQTFHDGWRVLRTILRERFSRSPRLDTILTLAQQERRASMTSVALWRAEFYSRFGRVSLLPSPLEAATCPWHIEMPQADKMDEQVPV